MADQSGGAGLSAREAQIADRYVEGQSYKEIARDLAIAPGTVRTHLNAIYRKLEVSSRIELLNVLRNDAGFEPSPIVPPETGPAPAPTAGPERRQLTVLFVDIVESTEIGAGLDEEEMYELLSVFRGAVRQHVDAFGGHASRFSGDGGLAAFGWPTAMEDSPERAVAAARAIAAGAGDIPVGAGARLSVRVGVATGMVVVDEFDGETGHFSGSAINLASRLQALAAPGEVVISELTRRLVGKRFDSEALEPVTLKGFREPVQAWRVTGERNELSRYEARLDEPRKSSMLGREHEFSELSEMWQEVMTGQGGSALVIGQAGIGKSRLAEAVAAQVAGENGRVLRLQGSERYNESPLWPVRRAIANEAELDPEAPAAARQEALRSRLTALGMGEIGAALIIDLLDLGGNVDLPQMSPQRRRALMLEALVQVVSATAKESPLLLMMEDVHWFDPTTVEFAGRLLKDPSESPAMVLMTSRPEGVPEGLRAPGIVRIELSPLDPNLAANLVRERAGETVLDAGAVEAIVARGDGVPLFLEEATSAFLETGAETVPASLRDSLTARLDRLGDLRDVAQVAAALGRDVDSDILREVSGDRTRAEAGVERLVSMGLAERRPGGFVFSHALVQDAAYHSLLRSKRRTLHEKISEVLLGRFRRRFQGEPELLAHHLEQAGRESAAIDYYLRAADMATNRAANAEAQQYARRALELCDLLPTGQERDRKEVTALLALGRIKMSLEGYGSEETGNVLRRALDRSRVAGLERTEFPLLVGLAAFSSVAGDGARGLSYAMQARQLAEKLDDPVPWTMCGYVLGIAHCWRGERRDAAAAFESGVSNYDEKLHEQFLGLGAHDPGVVCKARGAFNRFHLNPTAEEYGRLEDGLELARGLAHAHSLNYALAWVARTAIEARDFDLARRAVSETLEIAEAQQFATWRSMGTYGAALIAAQCDPPATALEAAETALEMLPTGGNLCCLSHVKGLIADALRRLGRLPEAQAQFRDAIATAERGSMGLGLNETLRGYARCSLDLDADDVDGAEKILRRAVMLARRNGSRVDELRASSDLAEVLLEQGDLVAAHEILEPVLGPLQGSMLKSELERAECLFVAVR